MKKRIETKTISVTSKIYGFITEASEPHVKISMPLGKYVFAEIDFGQLVSLSTHDQSRVFKFEIEHTVECEGSFENTLRYSLIDYSIVNPSFE